MHIYKVIIQNIPALKVLQAVGLDNVDNTSDVDKPVSTA